MKRKSAELKAIETYVTSQKHNQEALGLMWLLNPEQDKLRRELPFIAEALETCLKYVSQESINELERHLRSDAKPLTTRQMRVKDSWARHKAQERRKVTNSHHEPGTGRFLPKKEVS